MDHEVLKEMEKALEGNKTIETLTLYGDGSIPGNVTDVTLPMEFCRRVLFGIERNTSLSEVALSFAFWDCPNDGRLVYVTHMLCDSVGCSV